MESPIDFTTPTVRPDRFFGLKKLTLEYDADSDSFYLYDPGEPHPAISVHLGDSLYARIDPRTGDLLGFHIEGYKTAFLARNDSVRKAWRALFDSQADAGAVKDFAQALAQTLVRYLGRHVTGTGSADTAFREHGGTRFIISAHA